VKDFLVRLNIVIYLPRKTRYCNRSVVNLSLEKTFLVLTKVILDCSAWKVKQNTLPLKTIILFSVHV